MCVYKTYLTDVPLHEEVAQINTWKARMSRTHDYIVSKQPKTFELLIIISSLQINCYEKGASKLNFVPTVTSSNIQNQFNILQKYIIKFKAIHHEP